MNDRGIFNFDVNDFDESYLGPFTWDLKRLLASLNLICHGNALSDDEIKNVLRVCVTSYLEKVKEFCNGHDAKFSLNLRNTSGPILDTLNETKIKSHVAHLDTMTCVENYDRRFIRSKMVKDVDEELNGKIRQVIKNFK